MEYLINCRSPRLKKALEIVVPRMMADLKISSKKKCLVISVERDCKSLGLTIELEPVNGIMMVLKPSPRIKDVFLTLAHELVHVKQIISGKLKSDGDGNKVWNGKFFHKDTPYLEQPWELQAYARQELVMRKAVCNDD